MSRFQHLEISMSQPFQHLEMDDFSNLVYRTPSYLQCHGEVSWVFWHLETRSVATFEHMLLCYVFFSRRVYWVYWAPRSSIPPRGFRKTPRASWLPRTPATLFHAQPD